MSTIFKTKTSDLVPHRRVLAWDTKGLLQHPLEKDHWVIRSIHTVQLNPERFTHWCELPSNPVSPIGPANEVKR